MPAPGGWGPLLVSVGSALAGRRSAPSWTSVLLVTKCVSPSGAGSRFSSFFNYILYLISIIKMFLKNQDDTVRTKHD